MIVGAAYLHVADNRLEVLGSVVGELGLVAAAAPNALSAVTAVVAVEQLLQQHTAHLLHHPADLEFRGSQVHAGSSLALLKEPLR